MVSSRGSVTYGVAKDLAKELKPLIGKLPHHIQSTRDFVSRVREVTFLPGECLNSFDVTALFTSVSIDPALTLSKIYWNRMILCGTDLYCQYRTLLNSWGSGCTIHTSLFKINSMNRLKALLWGLLLAP